MIRSGGELVALLPVALVGLLTAIVPALTVPTLQFGVRIPPQRVGAPVVVRARRVYFWCTGTVAVGLLAVALFAPSGSGWLTAALVLVQLAAVLGSYFLARERIIAVKDAEDWYGGLRQTIATDTSWRTDPERFPGWWLVPALAVVGATVATGIVRYPHLPAQLPVHFAAGGAVDRYAATTVWSAFSLVFAQVFVTALIAGLLLVTYRSRPEVDAADAAGSTRRYRRFLAAMGRALLVLAALVDLSLLLVALQVWGVWRPSAAITAEATLPAVIGLVVVVAIAVRMGQAGARLDGAAPASAAGPGAVNRDDDRFWVGGLIYVNRRDPAVVVSKRFGVGWTLNFGNPRAWAAATVIAAAVVAFVIVRRR
jgi:uncharacterized membrane protein